MKSTPKIIISVLALVIAAAHVFLPSITIDTITLILLVLATLPWLMPFIKDFEIPGVIKISLPETKAATDKLSGDHIVKVNPAQLKLITHPAKIEGTIKVIPEFESLRTISETEPNLALVGFRIEIEKRIVKIAELLDIQTERVGLTRLVNQLAREGVISSISASGLSDLIALGNQAAHGAEVSREAAEWVLDVGPSILRQLEEVELPEE